MAEDYLVSFTENQLSLYSGDWSFGLELEWEKDADQNVILDQQTNQRADGVSNVESLPFGSLLQHSWINEDETLLERSARLEVLIAPSWKSVEGTNGLFYFNSSSRTCCWTQPYQLPPGVPLLSHNPPLGVFSRKRTKKENQELTEENEDDGFTKARQWKRKKDGVHELTPEGKSAISFLQEFSSSILRCGPLYVHSVLEDPANPFCTIVSIRGKEYGMGRFTNKKQSKQLAAENALEQLCPGVFPLHSILSAKHSKEKRVEEVVESRDALMIDDERVLLLQQLGKTPAQLLQEYCNREGITIDWRTEKIVEADTSIFRESVNIGGDLICHGDGKNKKDAKQRAAQQFLKICHPNVHSWSDLLKLFGQNRTGEKTKYPTCQLLVTLKQEIRAAIAKQSFCVVSDHPEALMDGSQGERSNSNNMEQ